MGVTKTAKEQAERAAYSPTSLAEAHPNPSETLAGKRLEFQVQRLGDRLVGDLALVRVEPAREDRILHGVLQAEIGDPDAKGERRVVEREGRGAGDRARH